MRLKNMYIICKRNIDALIGIKFEIEKRSVGGANYDFYKCVDWSEVKSALAQITAIPILKQDSENVMLFMEDKKDPSGRIFLDQKSKQTLENQIYAIADAMKTIIELCASLGYEELGEAVEGFDILLPPDMDFEDHISCFKDINLILSQCPFLKQKDTSIKFNMIDLGTTWLTFFIVGAGAVSLLAALARLVDNAIIIRSHKLTLDHQTKMIQRTQSDQSVIDSVTNSFAVIMDSATEAAIEDMENGFGKCADGEDRQRVKETLKRLCELMDKGLEIHSAIESKEETRALFPPIEKQRLEESTLKLLGKMSNSKEE